MAITCANKMINIVGIASVITVVKYCIGIICINAILKHDTYPIHFTGLHTLKLLCILTEFRGVTMKMLGSDEKKAKKYQIFE